MPLAKVLLVHDSPPLRDLVKRYLAALPAAIVQEAGAPAEALAAAAQTPPDAVLLGATLPGLDAGDFVARLNDLKLRFAPVVMLLQGDDAPLPVGIAGNLPVPMEAARFAAEAQRIFDEARYLAAFDNLQALGDEEFVVEMIDLFLEAGSEKLDEAKTSFTADDLTTLGRAVHSLKSSAANLGADELSDLARQAELLARQQESAPVGALLPRLEQAFTATRARLTQRKATGR